jgi:tetratricopeptide (TPR) repeat protein
MVFLLQDPTWAPFLSLFDAGAQRPVARTVLRVLLIGGCLLGLLLPTRLSEVSKSSFPWVGLFLLSGLLSVGMSGRPYTAEMEWETWAMMVLLAVLIQRVSLPALKTTALIALYIVAFAVYFHVLWISIPGTTSQLGGVFHHPNALSTFTLFILPFLIDRARGGGLEGGLASFLSGAILAVQLWAGSLTGACILVFCLACWLTRSRPVWQRLVTGLVVLPLPVLFNFWGGWVAVIGFSTLFLLLLFLVLVRLSSRYFVFSLIFLISLVISCSAFAFLASAEMSSRSTRGRATSARARLEFYRAALFLTAEEPLFGQGPSAFSREYPRYQNSVRYFSRYVHCVPLEVLLEWGVLGFAFGVFAAGSLFGRRTEAAPTWAFAAFGLHCLTGVQTQFPYLLVLVALAWALTCEPPENTEKVSFWVGTVGRVSLIVALLGLLSLNMLRLESEVNQGLATKLFNSPAPRAQEIALNLFRTSVELQPMDGPTLLTYAQVQLRLENRVLARTIAEQAIETDQQWAAPRRVELSAGSSPPNLLSVEMALDADPVNYPLFYRLQAEALLSRGSEKEALRLLLSRVESYNPLLLNSLHDFRAEDLDAQLVEYWLLIALLQEKAGQPKLAEKAFRRSLFFTRRALSRYRKMVAYPSQAGLKAGPIVAQLLAQLEQQLPDE